MLTRRCHIRLQFIIVCTDYLVCFLSEQNNLDFDCPLSKEPKSVLYHILSRFGDGSRVVVSRLLKKPPHLVLNNRHRGLNTVKCHRNLIVNSAPDKQFVR